MSQEKQSSKDPFDQARNARVHDIERMRGADRERAEEIREHHEQVRAETRDRHTASFNQDVIDEKNRLRLEQMAPHLKPRYMESTTRKKTDDELTREARHNVNLRNEGEIKGIDTAEMAALDKLRRAVSEREAREEAERIPDMEVESPQQRAKTPEVDRAPERSEFSDHDQGQGGELEFGGFYSPEVDRDFGPER